MIFIGFLLGFIGYLPVGNINLTVVQLSVSDKHERVWLFILFAALMEFIYCFFSLYGLERLLREESLIATLNWAGVVIFFALGLFSILHKVHADTEQQFSSGIKRGVLIAIFNPLQIPFWLVWGIYVMEKGWVRKEIFSMAVFSLLCSVGTIAVLWLYAYAGKKFVARLNLNAHFLNRMIGGLLILLAVLQSVKLLLH